jgi:hypothetical protein
MLIKFQLIKNFNIMQKMTLFHYTFWAFDYKTEHDIPLFEPKFLRMFYFAQQKYYYNFFGIVLIKFIQTFTLLTFPKPKN